MPLLRYGAVVVNFQPIALTPSEILAIADNHPEYLTPNDIIGAASEMAPDKAIALYKRSLERYPDAVELYINMAYNFIQINELENAEKILEDGAIVADDQKEKDMIQLQRACVFMKKGMYDKASAALDAVSDNNATKYYRGVLAIYNGQNAQAAKLLAEA